MPEGAAGIRGELPSVGHLVAFVGVLAGLVARISYVDIFGRARLGGSAN